MIIRRLSLSTGSLLKKNDPTSASIAVVQPGVIARLEECPKGTYCKITVSDEAHTKKGWFKFYIERNNEIETDKISAVDVKRGEETVAGASYTLGETYCTINFTVPNGTNFNNDAHSIDYRILVSATTETGDYTGETIFSVTGVKDGEEGSTYNLVLSPNKIKKNSRGEILTESVTCYVAKDMKVLTADELQASGLSLSYSLYEDGHNRQTYNNSIPVNFFRATGSVYVFLSTATEDIDTDCCVIIEDGTDAQNLLVLDIDNEMDAVALGSDYVLDVATTVGSNLTVYSGSTAVSDISKVKIEGTGNLDGVVVTVNSEEPYEFSGDTAVEFTFSPTVDKVTFSLTFPNGFEFDSADPHEKFTLTVYRGSNSLIKTYSVLGIKGGRDGEVYRLVLSSNVITFDPNTNEYFPGFISAEAYIGTEEIENAKIYYDVDGSGTETLLSDGQVIIGGTEGVNPEEQISFIFRTGDETVVLDRETVPVIKNGIDTKNRLVLELTNEIEAIGIGNDNVLDTDVDAETPLALLYDGDPVPISKVVLQTENEELDGCVCEIIVDGTSARGVIDNQTVEIVAPSNYGNATLSIHLMSGISFDLSTRKIGIKVIAYKGGSSTMSSSRVFNIMGIESYIDGVVYRLMPSVSSIQYNPNSEEYTPSAITCDAYENATIIEWNGKLADEQYLGARNVVEVRQIDIIEEQTDLKVGSTVIICDGIKYNDVIQAYLANDYTGCTVVSISETEETVTITVDSDIIGMQEYRVLVGVLGDYCFNSKYEVRYSLTGSETDSSDLPQTGITNSVFSSTDRITFFLYATENQATPVLVDRESVPIVIGGVNPYFLNISNQNIEIICRNNGEFIESATTPSCTLTLYRGGDIIDWAKFEFDGEDYGLVLESGGTIDTSNIRYFEDDTVSVLVNAIVGGEVVANGQINLVKLREGGQGLKGATVRGPVNWEETTAETRYFYNGEYNSAAADSEKYIDVIKYGDDCYYCNETYLQFNGASWESVSEHWTKSDTFDFVATNLLLAKNAKIDFLSGNEIHLCDENGTVTGGAAGRSTASTPDNAVAFWAGGATPDASGTKFTVTHSGKIKAVGGEFKGSISAETGYFKGSISAETGYFNGYVTSLMTKIIDLKHKGEQVPGKTGFYEGYTLKNQNEAYICKVLSLTGSESMSACRSPYATSTTSGVTLFLPNDVPSGFELDIVVGNVRLQDVNPDDYRKIFVTNNKGFTWNSTNVQTEGKHYEVIYLKGGAFSFIHIGSGDWYFTGNADNADFVYSSV